MRPVPAHVGIIMDGNGRWASARGLERSEGHRAGTDNISRVAGAFAERGVKYVTIFGFSTENWSRPPEEVDALMEILGEVIEQETIEAPRTERARPASGRPWEAVAAAPEGGECQHRPHARK